MKKYLLQPDHEICGPIAVINVRRFFGKKGTGLNDAKALYQYTGRESGTDLKVMDKFLNKDFDAIYILDLRLSHIDYALDNRGCVVIHYDPLDASDPAGHFATIVEKTETTYHLINHWDVVIQEYKNLWVTRKKMVSLIRQGDPNEGCGWVVFSDQ